ncbi:hypothetical protein Z945_2894 [Sulfitobacter noctilucae]|uniref:hypothetical protein n=1 Tax=Sulfitobacter noctilucae TaxID=1342302 RepID=UPI0004682179|nr:hypothetical protein [Sulfitobacter noctilucae]KIN74996.1 hypothetical protein Z945_2894 [Sulfitobacter noctilucae]
MKLKFTTAALMTSVLLIAACDDSDNAGGEEATGIDTFGAAFRAMFDADANAEPVDAQSINISVNSTADPFNP